MSLQENYTQVEEGIAAACAKAGRRREEVHLIAVSKTHAAEKVQEVFALGQKAFGENRIAELAEKRSQLDKSIEWHLIGQLQTNKVKLLPQETILHTLDRESLVQKLASHFTSVRPLRCLIQVNCSREPQKSGVSIEDFFSLAEKIAAEKALRVLGLMTMAEHSTEETTIRQAFADLRKLSQKVTEQRLFEGYAGWLSMGMSGDFGYAIQEGATHVRIGSAIFGERTFP